MIEKTYSKTQTTKGPAMRLTNRGHIVLALTLMALAIAALIAFDSTCANGLTAGCA